jgi:hypothetical protein
LRYAGLVPPREPTDADVHFDLAMAYVEMGLISDAIGELLAALQADPRHLRARAELAALRRRRNRPGDEPPDDVA